MKDIQLTIEQIEKLEPLQIVENPLVRDKFIYIYDTLRGKGTGEAAYTRESVYFNRILRDADGGKLQKATKFSIFTAFIELAVCGLSLEPGSRAQCYLVGRNVNVGTRENPKWEGRCVLTVSGYGELVLRARAGQIRHADNPVLVYDNDEFTYSDIDGRKSVSYIAHLPHAGHKIIACYLGITRADGSRDYGTLFEEDWLRLMNYSAKQNRRGPNELYGRDDNGGANIDPGFLCAKCIKHAFRSYPKVRVGRNTELQSEQADGIGSDDIADVVEDENSTSAAHQDFVVEEAAVGINVNPADDGAF